MTTEHDRIQQLNEKLEYLLQRQVGFAKEIEQLRREIHLLRSSHQKVAVEANKVVGQSVAGPEPNYQEIRTPGRPPGMMGSQQLPKFTPRLNQVPSSAKSDLEKFIGENLINKIGIAITVIGVAIGAKYSIEHQLISPLTRIILGYLVGLGLLGTGIRLKQHYENYSAVLVSGAMAIMYLITYAAYRFYDLFPQVAAFALMLIFTAFTVVAAIRYNKEVIAHIGMVGAYAVPFLLSEDSGRVEILFSYMTIINIGVLVIAFLRYWKSLYYSSFTVTWLIFIVWYNNNFKPQEHFGISLTFLSIFFLTFYAMFVSYKLRKQEKFELPDILLLLLQGRNFNLVESAVYLHRSGY